MVKDIGDVIHNPFIFDSGCFCRYFFAVQQQGRKRLGIVSHNANIRLNSKYDANIRLNSKYDSKGRQKSARQVNWVWEHWSSQQKKQWTHVPGQMEQLRGNNWCWSCYQKKNVQIINCSSALCCILVVWKIHRLCLSCLFVCEWESLGIRLTCNEWKCVQLNVGKCCWVYAVFASTHTTPIGKHPQSSQLSANCSYWCWQTHTLTDWTQPLISCIMDCSKTKINGCMFVTYRAWHYG